MDTNDIKVQKKPDMGFGTRVVYLRDERKFPIAAIALTRRREDPDAVAVGVSIWNPKDAFNKALGRKIAVGRSQTLIGGRPTNYDNLAFYVIGRDDLTVHGLVSAIYEVCLETGVEPFPRRVMKALARAARSGTRNRESEFDEFN